MEVLEILRGPRDQDRVVGRNRANEAVANGVKMG